VPLSELAQGGLISPRIRSTLHSFLRGTPMFDEMWQEIQDAPGEIFDIPELRDEDDFNLNDYLAADYDY
jgi:hypothetical protein